MADIISEMLTSLVFCSKLRLKKKKKKKKRTRKSKKKKKANQQKFLH